METAKNLKDAVKKKILITEVPAYGNKLFYSLGFLALTCLTALVVTGLVMIFFGPAWWLAAPAGMFFRSVHLWAAQALILIVILHVLVVFLTSGFKAPRRLTWILGAAAFFLILLEAEFGYDLRGDFSSQYRALQAADFFNGAFVGKIVNTLDYGRVFGIHAIYIPLAVLIMLFCHYLLVKIRGIAKPYREDIKVKMVPADHRKLFARGLALMLIIIVLAFAFPSPLITPATIAEVAKENPSLMAGTLIAELTRASGTATYLDSIDPYQFDTRTVYVTVPYEQFIAANQTTDQLAAFDNEPSAMWQQNINDAADYFKNGGAVTIAPDANPLIPAISALVIMAKSGLYESVLDSEAPDNRPEYSLRFLADTGVLENEASELHITTGQWGMMREEKGALPPGAWWLAPVGFLDHTILANDDNGDRDGAIILGALAALLVLFPFIPYLNRLPEKLGLAEKIWKS